MATSSFDKKFVVKDSEISEKILKELEMVDEHDRDSFIGDEEDWPLIEGS